MLSVPNVLAILAIGIGLIMEIQQEGRNLAGWGIILLGTALIWSAVT
jgi:hypothetical protein